MAGPIVSGSRALEDAEARTLAVDRDVGVQHLVGARVHDDGGVAVLSGGWRGYADRERNRDSA